MGPLHAAILSARAEVWPRPSIRELVEKVQRKLDEEHAAAVAAWKRARMDKPFITPEQPPPPRRALSRTGFSRILNHGIQGPLDADSYRSLAIAFDIEPNDLEATRVKELAEAELKFKGLLPTAKPAGGPPIPGESLDPEVAALLTLARTQIPAALLPAWRAAWLNFGRNILENYTRPGETRSATPSTSRTRSRR